MNNSIVFLLFPVQYLNRTDIYVDISRAVIRSHTFKAIYNHGATYWFAYAGYSNGFAVMSFEETVT